MIDNLGFGTSEATADRAAKRGGKSPQITKFTISSQNPPKILTKLRCSLINQTLLLNQPFSVVFPAKCCCYISSLRNSFQQLKILKILYRF